MKKPLPPVIDGEQPTNQCDPKVYSKGTSVFVTHTIRSWNIERWVRKVAERSGQPVDWHWCGGRAVVLALGDLNKVYEAMNHFKDEHDRLYLEAHKTGPFPDDNDEFIMRGCPQVGAVPAGFGR